MIMLTSEDITEADNSGDSGYTLDEAFVMLKKKHNKISLKKPVLTDSSDLFNTKQNYKGKN